ncbi:MAG: acetylglutamate kinase [Winogradskyella sp.]|nr:acetylglutamate kinase [Winogradskyella sp.]
MKMETLKIVKIGGNIIDNDKELSSFLDQFSTIKGPKILVHGGGKLASKLAEQLAIPVNMNHGRRITDAETLDVITMVYAGKINKTIVSKLQSFNCNAVGLSGADGNCIVSKKRPIKDVDYGFVGDVIKVNTETLDLLIAQGITPVLCAITHDEKGQLLNTNADTIAAELAIAFASTYYTSLYYCFEKNGVLRDVTDEDSIIETINATTYNQLIKNGSVAEGMLPKLNNCMYAVENKVVEVCIGRPQMLFDESAKCTKIIL